MEAGETHLLSSLYSGELTHLSLSLSSTLIFGGFSAIRTQKILSLIHYKPIFRNWSSLSGDNYIRNLFPSNTEEGDFIQKALGCSQKFNRSGSSFFFPTMTLEAAAYLIWDQSTWHVCCARAVRLPPWLLLRRGGLWERFGPVHRSKCLTWKMISCAMMKKITIW